MSKGFGSHLRKLRKQNSKYSQQQMADMLNISRSTYTYYETGKSEPGQDKLKKLCEILNVDFNTLLSYSDPGYLNAKVASGESGAEMFNSLSPSEEQIVLALRNMNSEEREYIGKQITKIIKSNK
ncbi:MAG: helix-turn-helix transcriptional regulator [Ruminococcus sp.]|nr:helix-turn-helix transcriptional regulator [Ruminococcus sp.]